MLKHTGIYLTNADDKKNIIRILFNYTHIPGELGLSGLHGELFSSITIDKLIDEEFRHDKIIVSTNNNTSLSTMSSGQQKKALLDYLILQKPGFIILDDAFGNVDSETTKQIQQKISDLATEILFIQIAYRLDDFLPIISQMATNIGDSSVKIQSKEEFITKHSALKQIQHRIINIPDPYIFPNNIASPLIQLRNLRVSYEEKEVFNNLNWEINKAEFWQLKGPNGSGKSTLISMICGDNPKAYGQNMQLFGYQKGHGETIWDIKKHIGYFTPNMLVRFTKSESVENMILSGFNDSVGLYTEATDIQKDIANQWVGILGEKFRNKDFQKLSVGQQRMVMVARAMAKKPDLLILDEPTIELDDENSALFIELIQAIANTKSTAIIYISHREEASLKPHKIYELKPTGSSYSGYISR